MSRISCSRAASARGQAGKLSARVLRQRMDGLQAPEAALTSAFGRHYVEKNRTESRVSGIIVMTGFLAVARPEMLWSAEKMFVMLEKATIFCRPEKSFPAKNPPNCGR